MEAAIHDAKVKQNTDFQAGKAAMKAAIHDSKMSNNPLYKA